MSSGRCRWMSAQNASPSLKDVVMLPSHRTRHHCCSAFTADIPPPPPGALDPDTDPRVSCSAPPPPAPPAPQQQTPQSFRSSSDTLDPGNERRRDAARACACKLNPEKM
ncbi:hypothetical protein EYF80_054220 [Liparis tanakae]|uniref:Uncharacterized protein n=1 Tax=Liparis tanakae TaxID=230148 RepID=A0A4Z2F313_9TELE|nr:hypothetical protein EYF80_054220 [Liparis tanakae]